MKKRYFIAVPVVSIAALYGFLCLPIGKNVLVSIINKNASSKEQTIRIEKITGNLLSDMTVTQVTLADPDGVWLDIQQARLAWSPMAFITKGQVIEAIEVGKIDLKRLPKVSKDKKPDEPKKETSFNDVLKFLPKKIDISQFLYENQDISLKASGVPTQYAISLQTSGGPETTLDGEFSFKESLINASLIFDAAPQGIVPRLLQLPENASIHAKMKVYTQPGETITLEPSEIKIGNSEIYAQGLYTIADQSINGEMTFSLPDISQFQLAAGTPLSGAILGNIKSDGTLKALHNVLDIQSNELSVSNHVLQDLSLKANAVTDVASWSKNTMDTEASIEAKTLVDGIQTSFQAQAEAEKSLISLDNVQAAYGAYEVKGNVEADLISRELKASIATNQIEIQTVLPKSQLTGTGNLTADILGSFENIVAKAKAEILSSQGNSLLETNAEIDTAYKTVKGDLNVVLRHDKQELKAVSEFYVDADRAEIDNLEINGPGIEVTGNGKWRLAEKQGEGDASINIDDLRPVAKIIGLPLAGQVKAELQMQPRDNGQNIELSLDKLQLSYADQDIKLKSATKFAMAGNDFELKPTTISVAGGTLVLQGIMTEDKVDASLKADRLALSKFVSGIDDAYANGVLTLKGTPSAPIAVLKLQTKAVMDDYPLNLGLNGTWREGKLHLDALAQTKGNDKTANAKAVADMKADLSLVPFKAGISAETPVTATLSTQLPLEVLNPLVWPQGHRLSGNIAGKVNVGGSLGQPRYNGRLVLEKGSYAHVSSGICLRGTHGIIDFSADRITVRELASRDASGGTLKIDSRLGMNGNKPINGSIAFNHFQLFCGGLATGQIDGKINLNGALSSLFVAGKLTLGPLNVQLPGASNETGIPEVETIRVTRDSKKKVEEGEQKIRLNVSIDAPGRIFVRGRGLDAEFEGNLNITGSASNPDLRGQFNARRGKFTLLDRVLKLAKASIRFEGPIPPAPFLDINAETKVQSTTLTLTLSGSAIKPSLALSSQPSLPQDEAMSLFLFGRQLQNISPFQALKLAQATRTLAGLDGGEPGVLDKARGALGLDSLDVGTDDSNNVTVNTGKYVTEKVYVGVQQGATPESREITTEIEVTPSVSANTSVDGDGNQGFGLGWKHDY